ncbi:MAG: hypothetical protein AAB758_01515 [Patescibacteria group bacterium]
MQIDNRDINPEEEKAARLLASQINLRSNQIGRTLEDIQKIGEKIEKKERERVTSTSAGLMIGTAIFYDALQAILSLIPYVGWILSSCISIFAWLTFYVWTSIKGWNMADTVAFSSIMKKLTPTIAKWLAPLIELIPIVNVVPAWTISVSLQLSFLKAEEVLYDATKGRVDIDRLMELYGNLHSVPGAFTEMRHWQASRKKNMSQVDNMQRLNPSDKSAARNNDVIIREPSTKSAPRVVVNENLSKVSPENSQEEPLNKLPQTGKKLELTNGKIAEQMISLDNLVFVRADFYAPKIVGGNIIIENAYDATNGSVKRLTNHFSLNHRVVSNIGGNWDSAPYTFVIPAAKMFAENGSPDNLYSVDSFWAKSVLLPKGSVIIYEKGFKPKLGAQENAYVLIERNSEIARTQLFSDIIDRMGYTEIGGSDRGVSMKDENFDKNLEGYTKEKNIRWGLHEFSWSDTWENAEAFLEDSRPDMALNSLINLSRTDPEESARMPQDLKGSLLKEIFADIDLLPQSKNNLINSIGEILEENGPDQKFIIESISQATWKQIKEEMLSNIGPEEVYATQEEASEAFVKLFAAPYEAITGHKLDV